MHHDVAVKMEPLTMGRIDTVGISLPEQVQNNAEVLDALSEALATLESRLSPVLVPQEAPDGMELSALPADRSPLGATLLVQQSRLQELVARVGSLSARVEL